MENKAQIRLTSSEIAQLWGQYMNGSASIKYRILWNKCLSKSKSRFRSYV